VAVLRLYRQVWNCKEMKLWRHQVIQRDRSVCQRCGRIENNRKRSEGYIGTEARKRLTLEVHHKKPLGFLLEFHGIKTLSEAMRCRGLWDIRNGITMCADCHRIEELTTRFSVFLCKDCNTIMIGTEKFLTHQQLTGHRHRKKLGLLFDLSYEERCRLREETTI
jgi:hypothetical protein